MAIDIFKRIRHGPNYQMQMQVCASPPPISGFEASEQHKVVRAWNLAEKVPNAHRLHSVRNITKGNSKAGATAAGGHVTVDQAIHASEKELAAVLVHEAAHCDLGHITSTPRTECEAATEENIARRHLGLQRKDPNDFSWHKAQGYSDSDDTDATGGVTDTDQTADESKPAKKSWIEIWCMPNAERIAYYESQHLAETGVTHTPDPIPTVTSDDGGQPAPSFNWKGRWCIPPEEIRAYRASRKRRS